MFVCFLDRMEKMAHDGYEDRMFDALAVSAQKALEENLLACEFELEEDDGLHGISEAFLNHIDQTIPRLGIIVCGSGGDTDYGKFYPTVYMSPCGKRDLNLKEDEAPCHRRKDWLNFTNAKRLTCVHIPRV